MKDSKISSEEGRRIVDDFISKTSAQRKEFEEEIKILAAKFGVDYGSTTQGEIEDLKARVSHLEQKMNGNKEKMPLATPSPQDQQDTVVEKVANNGRVSLADEVLTPEKKMEAEQQRLKQRQEDRPAAQRVEEDTQKANLSQPPLTPDKKMEQDRKNISKNID
ncbi:hypothetical protein [Nafulsella turpanensis]|uniref:hypothetical protein n=1 Tax=Nafulsella turpanensis TaxID=1265690 RepID=UPI0003457B63|nr:hypothetical protein [Nafulsella turpanensis]